MQKLKTILKKAKKKTCDQHFQWTNEKGEIESFCCKTYKEEAQYMTAGPVHIGKCLKCTEIDKLEASQNI